MKTRKIFQNPENLLKKTFHVDRIGDLMALYRKRGME